ncbi:hypothetical protein M405DRAFT_772319 [Rhizopogon salebrosus TDB-379]|nr:hypothetical protein M405DRAFT_772319 [Rhizopogon salebrosus TDB-379]
MDASAEPTGPVSAPAATSAQKASSDAPRRSARIKLAENKRTSEHLGSNELSSKRLKSSDEKRDDKEEPPKEHPIVQNGLYVAEKQGISCIVKNDIFYAWYFDR